MANKMFVGNKMLQASPWDMQMVSAQPLIWIWVTLMVLVGVVGCGQVQNLAGGVVGRKSEKDGHQNNRAEMLPDNKASVSAESALPAVARNHVQDPVEPDQKAVQEIMPIAYLRWRQDDVSRNCMLGYLGDGIAVTAGHCIDATGFHARQARVCDQYAEIIWLVNVAGHYETLEEKVSCQNVVSYFNGLDADTDVAFLALGSSGKMPESSLKLVPAGDRGENPKFEIFGSALATTPLVKVFEGWTVETLAKVFLHNASHGPGTSGSPLLVDRRPLKAGVHYSAIGIHLGQESGVGRGLGSNSISEFLEEARLAFDVSTTSLETP